MLKIESWSIKADITQDEDEQAEAGRGGAEPKALVITKLSSGVRDQQRVNVFLNNKFAFSLDVAQVIELNVKLGQTVTAERLEELKSASEFGLLYQRALEWVLTRPHSVRETRDYLWRRKAKRKQMNYKRANEQKKPLPEIRDETLELVLERLITRGYLDDAKFARYYVENRFVNKGVSKRRLRMELQKKGVAQELIDTALSEAMRDESAEIRKVIKKKAKNYDDQKLLGYLARQGFDLETARAEIAKYRAECEAGGVDG